jgi:hypothetical protein
MQCDCGCLRAECEIALACIPLHMGPGAKTAAEILIRWVRDVCKLSAGRTRHELLWLSSAQPISGREAEIEPSALSSQPSPSSPRVPPPGRRSRRRPSSRASPPYDLAPYTLSLECETPVARSAGSMRAYVQCVHRSGACSSRARGHSLHSQTFGRGSPSNRQCPSGMRARFKAERWWLAGDSRFRGPGKTGVWF